MKKYYENANDNAAFIRCVDVLTQLMQKYGVQVLDAKSEETEPNNDTEAAQLAEIAHCVIIKDLTTIMQCFT